tara:strand:- start:1175 stop:1987 length:813 start_codon:yes stop_codon:yes gene_type:complete
MATIDLGKVKLVWRGTYNGSFNYVPDDVVYYTDGGVSSSYICVANSTGNAPSSGGSAHASWNYLAKGAAAYTSPTTTQGDLIVRGASADGRLAIGSAGQALKVNSSGNGLEYGSAGVDGITMADQWRVNSNFNSNSSDYFINANWERNDTHFAQIGTGMTYSGGTFTFPQTGIYWICFQMNCQGSNMQYMGNSIKISPDSGSSFYTRAENYDSGGQTAYFGSSNCECIVDVTNASLYRVRFHMHSSGAITTEGQTNSQRTGVTFIRLGDT